MRLPFMQRVITRLGGKAEGLKNVLILFGQVLLQTKPQETSFRSPYWVARQRKNWEQDLSQKRRIIGRPKMRQAGCSDVVDLCKVRHKSGGIVTINMKTYEQGWRKWQGTAPKVVWLDEEPDDFKIYTESLTRLLTSHGLMLVTFTPLLGQTQLVRHFQESENKGVWVGTATWNDAPHLLKVERERMARSYPRHELQARTMGVPMMGEGAVFTTSEDEIVVDPFSIPSHYARITGIDFGLDHPFACAKIAIDRDNDIIYVYDDYRKKGEINLAFHAEKIKNPHPWIRVSWPHDGAKRSPGSGGKESQSLKTKMQKLGVNMLSKSARYKNETWWSARCVGSR